MSKRNSSFASDKPEITAESRKELAEFIARMHEGLEGWMRETADLADELIHGLDSLFDEYKDVKVMIIGTLEVLIENLQYGRPLSHAYLAMKFVACGLIMISDFG